MTSGEGPNTYPSNVKCLFTLQKKAYIICNADRFAHINAMFKDMSILKLSEFVKYKTAIVCSIYSIVAYRFSCMGFYQIFECSFYTSKKSFVVVQVRTNL